MKIYFFQSVAQQLCAKAGMKAACLYGGAPKREQAEQLRRGVDIAIATPGRLWDFVEFGTTNLDRCTFLVLDEADRLVSLRTLLFMLACWFI